MSILSRMDCAEFQKFRQEFTGNVSENLEKMVLPENERLVICCFNKITELASSHQEYVEGVQQLFAPFQEGRANQNNFMWQTVAEFTERNTRPNRSPDYMSYDRYGEVSSEYWYEITGVVRGSDHWGPGVASCDWSINTISAGGILRDNPCEICRTSKRYGTAKWTEFVHKPEIIMCDGEIVGVSTFENTITKELVRINLVKYRKHPWNGEWDVVCN